MRVLVLAKEDHQAQAAKPPTPEAILEFQKFNEELIKAGVVLGVTACGREGNPLRRRATLRTT